MACGCKKARTNPPEHTPTADSMELVSLSLNPGVVLPVRFPRAVNGKDLIVTDDATQFFEQAVTVHGHDAQVQRGVRSSLTSRFPNLFTVTE